MGPNRPSGRIQGLDVIRGIAVAFVLLRHANQQTYGGAGILGVTMFFALSGYLITGILLKDIQHHGRVRYGRFYRNRAIRLLPPLVAMLAVYALITLTINPDHDTRSVPKSILIGLFYISNYPHIEISNALGHLWTLATEEQFYIVWPVILAIGVKIRSLAVVLILSAIAIVGTLIYSLNYYDPRFGFVYKLPTSWAIAMIIGAAAQIYRPHIAPIVARVGRLRTPLVLILIALLATRAGGPDIKGEPNTYLYLVPAIAVGTIALIYLMEAWERIPSPIWYPALWLGTISYAAYLWNLPILQWNYPLRTMDERIMVTTLTIGAAILSWFLVERPSHRFRTWLDRRGQEQRAAVTISPVETPTPVKS